MLTFLFICAAVKKLPQQDFFAVKTTDFRVVKRFV